MTTHRSHETTARSHGAPLPRPKSSRTTSGIAQVFAGPAVLDVLGLFCLQPDRDYYQREIAEATGRRIVEVQRALTRLEAAELVVRTKRGRHVYYRPLRAHPAFSHLRGLVLATVGLADVLRPPLLHLGSGVQLAFVYGSLAQGTDTADSDIDLMIVGTVSTRQIVEAMEDACGVLGREVNPGVYSPEEFRQKFRSGGAFLQNVVASPKIWLVGSDEELAALPG
jgi:predicted nucleotidyltransferase